ncbi:MAG TPA: preprotein translocase subunit SecY, partial [Pyrodictium sp.]|nr:preprotein translocase subunit SecY [Pyrodictium sp.]
TKPRDRRLFMGAQRTLALLFAVFEASMYALGCTFWRTALGGGITACPATPLQRVGVVAQLTLATLVLILFDELTRKGWGIGSALSLFIVANVAKGMFWEIGGPIPVPGTAGTHQYYGVLAEAILNGNWAGVVLREGLPDLVGLIATFVIIAILVYLQLMRVYIPIASPRLGTIRSRIPLQFLYVTNIPILFVAIFVADIQVFAGIAAALGGPTNPIAQALHTLAIYMTPPRGLLNVASEPLRALTSTIAWITLSIVFGFIWVEVAGLNPEKQAENIVKSGLQIPGIRRSTRLLAKLLEKYIYPLTLISSIIVGTIAVVADFFGAYGSGSGLVLTVGIVYNFYLTLAYERTLEMYPVLRRLIS